MKPLPGQTSWEYACDLNLHHDGPWTEEERMMYGMLVEIEMEMEREGRERPPRRRRK